MKTLAEYVHGFASREGTAFVYRTGFRRFSYSYADVYRHALGASALLQQKGLKKGDCVLLWAPNSPEWGFFLLGCVLTGVVAVPVDVRADVRFVRSIQQQVRAKLLFRSRFRPALQGVESVIAEDFEHALQGANKLHLPHITPDDIVELLYTSGTTSSPKGVVLTHRNLASNMEGVRGQLPVDSSYRLLSLLPLSHIFEQTLGFFLPLSGGAVIVYARTLKPSVIRKLIREERITNVLVVPRILAALEHAIRHEAEERGMGWLFALMLKLADALPFALRRYLFWPVHLKLGLQFRFFAVGGAPFSSAQERFWERLGVLVLQGYGLTEASPLVALNLPKARSFGSAGRILPLQEVRIADDGEIMVRGPNVTRGYYHDAAKTRAVFSDGWLRTGDAGSVNSDGFLFLKGRKKHVIVTSAGMNVYAEDVEAALNSLPGIQESCVVSKRTREGETVHAVLLTALPAEKVTVLVAKANAQLMEYQQIAGYTIWMFPDFPRTPTLKVKKGEVQAHIEGVKGVEERKQGQSRVMDIVTQVSGIPAGRITPDSRLGTDLKMGSIERVELVSLIETEFNMDVDEQLIKAHTSVGELEQLIQRRAPWKQLNQHDYTRWQPLNYLRYLLQQFILRPFVHIYCHITVKGRENVPKSTVPLVFISNHVSQLDVPVILWALPLRYRAKLAIAMWGEGHKTYKLPWLYRPWEVLLKQAGYYIQVALINTYAFERTERSLQSMQYTGRLIDRGASILLFPEGQLTPTGKMIPFEKGIGVLARELSVPILPMRLDGLHRIMPRGSWWPRKRGKVQITFGRPIQHEEFRLKSPEEITRFLEGKIEEL